MSDKASFLTDVELHLKQIRVETLNEKEKAALASAFAGFADENRPTLEMVDSHLDEMRKRTGFQNQSFDPAHYRRYAGDSTLPRSRYYTIAESESGNDEGTLIRELRTYYNPANAGIIQIFDSTLPDDQEKLQGFSIELPSIIVNFLPLARNANPFASNYLDTLVPMFVNLPLFIETRLVRDVVDLRNPLIAQNFATSFSELQWEIDGATIPAFPFRSKLNRFSELLPSLLEQSIGGFGLTNMVGIWLRKLGAKGLIYPSARVDASVAVRNGVIIDAVGWNFVDFEQASSTGYETMVHLESEWPTSIRHTPEGPNDPYFYPIPAARVDFEVEGDGAGSWRVQGLRKAREALWRFSMAKECVDAFADDREKDLFTPVYEWLYQMFVKVCPKHHVSEPDPTIQDVVELDVSIEQLGGNCFALQEALLGKSGARLALLDFANSIKNEAPELSQAIQALLGRSSGTIG